MADEASPEAAERAFAAGASIYCVKTAEREDSRRPSGRRSGTPSTSQALGVAARSRRPEAETAEQALPDLTRREIEILRLVAEGHSNSQLARMLWVTEQTVKFHLSNIYRKLNVANRTEASRWAQLNGLLPATRQAAAV